MLVYVGRPEMKIAFNFRLQRVTRKFRTKTEIVSRSGTTFLFFTEPTTQDLLNKPDITTSISVLRLPVLSLTGNGVIYLIFGPPHIPTSGPDVCSCRKLRSIWHQNLGFLPSNREITTYNF